MSRVLAGMLTEGVQRRRKERSRRGCAEVAMGFCTRYMHDTLQEIRYVTYPGTGESGPPTGKKMDK